MIIYKEFSTFTQAWYKSSVDIHFVIQPGNNLHRNIKIQTTIELCEVKWSEVEWSGVKTKEV